MAKLNINPTRMELLQLKKRLKTAEWGHKLLKEKRDGLMKNFLTIVREAKTVREKIEQKLAQGFKAFVFAAADMRPDVMEEALIVPAKKISLEATTKNVMSVMIPQFTYQEEGDYLAYGLASTSSDLDTALEKFSEALKDLVKLAAIEHSAHLLATEIEKTRRRVNALEYVFIPNMLETTKYIQNKLNEQERSTLITLMKVKTLIEQQETALSFG